MSTTLFPTENRIEATPSDPPEVMAIDFDDDLLAQEALLATTRLARHGSVIMEDAVLVRKDAKGKTRYGQTREMDPARAAISGTLWGGLIGLLVYGLIGWVVGAVVVGLAAWLWARTRDVGVPNTWLHEVARRLPEGHTAAVFMLPTVFPTHLLNELARFKGRLMYSDLTGISPEDIEGALRPV